MVYKNMKTNIYFTSDTHFGHSNIIRYCHRPFKDVNEMDESIIQNINDVVKENDILYHLGDFCFTKHNYSRVKEYRDQINCRNVHLMLGNHDVKSYVMSHFASTTDYLKIKINTQKIILCHYPFAVWDSSHHGSFNLAGHSHGTFKPSLPNEISNGLCLDVGVDVHNFKPISIDQVISTMEEKKKLIKIKSE